MSTRYGVPRRVAPRTDLCGTITRDRLWIEPDACRLGMRRDPCAVIARSGHAEPVAWSSADVNVLAVGAAARRGLWQSRAEQDPEEPVRCANGRDGLSREERYFIAQPRRYGPLTGGLPWETGCGSRCASSNRGANRGAGPSCSRLEYHMVQPALRASKPSRHARSVLLAEMCCASGVFGTTIAQRTIPSRDPQAGLSRMCLQVPHGCDDGMVPCSCQLTQHGA